MIPQTVDVLLVGGGPTSLLITLILHRSGINAHVVEQHTKASQALLGRACVVYSATMEFLDSLDIYDSIADIGYECGMSLTYKNGQQLPNRGWKFVQEALEEGSTFFKYSLGLRQKYMESNLLSAISEIAQDVVHAPAQLIEYRVEAKGEYPVIATVEAEGKTVQVACKYLIGADGGRSTVRRLGNFPFPRINSPFKWIRLDAVIKTDMPGSRLTSIAIESEKHGNVLWIPIDHGRTRIGFVCPPEVYGDDGSGLTSEIIMNTAKEALLPFNLEFVTLDWWTVYQIGQGVVQTWRQGPVFLAGDSAHTHSSASAQGMNTGMHDASNLAWKLAGVLSGKFKEPVLDTYDLERRVSAEDLIAQDKNVSTLISGKIPSHFNAPPGADPNVWLDKVFRENATFTIGLGISYGPNLVNQANPNFPNVKIGHRAHDVLVYPSGPQVAQRLRSFLKHTGKFWIIVFAGQLLNLSEGERHPTLRFDLSEKYRKLREHIDAASQSLSTVSNFITLLHGPSVRQGAEAIGVPPLGKILYDTTGKAYELYGIDPNHGALLAVRPDGIMGFVGDIDGGKLFEYFASFSDLPRGIQKERKRAPSLTAGEISVEGQEERTQNTVK